MAVDGTIIEDFINAVKTEKPQNNTTHSAVVSKIDNEGTVWVYVAGSDKETPTSSSASEVKKGDAVNVEWRNNKLYISGNYSNPSAGTQRVAANEQATLIANMAAQDAIAEASTAHEAAESAQASATIAKTSAQTAKESADKALVNLSTVENVVDTLNWITAHGTMTSQAGQTFDANKVYFIRDNNGDYHVGSYYYSVVSEPVAEDINSYYTLSVDESIQNYVATHVAVDSEGLWLVPETNGNKVLIAVGGSGHAYPTAGTYIIDVNGDIVAQFLSNGTTINGSNGTLIANLGYGSGKNSGGGFSNAPYYALGTRESGSDIGNYSMTSGINNTASGYASCSFGSNTIVSNSYAVAEGRRTSSRGIASHSEGLSNHYNLGPPTINGIDASGDGSHAEGYASNNSNWSIKASGNGAHAEGYADDTHGDVIAAGDGSHAQNCGTHALSDYQTVIGVCNKDDSNGTYLLIIGNGDDNINRSDALTVDWDGKVTSQGALNAAGLPSGLTTEQHSDSTGSISATTDSGSKTITATKSGYYPLGVVGWNFTGTNYMYQNLYYCRISSASNGSATVSYRFRNNSSASYSGTFNVDILWVKI